MNDENHKAVVRKHLLKGERQSAINYLVEAYDGVDHQEAEKLLQVIESESSSPSVQSENSNAGCGGCFSILLKMASIFFMITSIGFLATAGFFYYNLKNNKLELVKVEAEIVEFKDVADTTQVYLVLRYEWEDESYRDVSGYPVDENDYQLSQLITVSINPHRPNQAYLEQETSLSLLNIMDQGEEESINDLTFVQLIDDVVTQAIIFPGLIFFALSIALWWVSIRMLRQT